MSRLIVLSNRVADRSKKASAGGLAVALKAALADSGGVWVGWSGQFADVSDPHVAEETHEGVTYSTFDLSRTDYEDYYNGFANRSLWPLFHYRVDLTTYDRRYYAGYQRVNSYFARAVAPLLTDDDIVWVHDFHLMLVGEELRRMGKQQAMGYFLHIPWPPSEILLTLPNHQALVRGLFAYDVIGFQTQSDLRSFTDYVLFEAGGEVHDDGSMSAFGRRILARVYPIGIDAKEFEDLTRSREARRIHHRMHTALGERWQIIGVDRLDYSKGLLERFGAVEKLFDAYPENKGRVSLLQIAPLSRSDVPEYIEMRHELEAAAGRINGRLAEYDWNPIRYTNRLYTRTALAGLYRASRVGLVTPFRDGMNLVAKEYIVAQPSEDPGVLVLSRFAGAAEDMDAALIVNPYDSADVVDALQKALHMSFEERRNRHQSLLGRLFRYDVHDWRNRFVETLEAVRTQRRDVPA
ncbi:alpha,alpha-trehalose-phosphate synthase (UDP-forming) [Oceanibacterium hippocampi]|uniref:Alpha,alpha-trehalose-phosphate synthase [UDP-forming] n=1 Tax=Oceanibacterium hippocampi TaxID=745714 RepID=A0A1Y5T8Q9_9PROT|nr:trehalose-6-phosphate synthase [Oceanibacterium hippocampi]SLN58441.1 Alpha,alpha-trehalose-phosphate synthase [UDP-forming] [Oceanibacterium hippocampi]